jgi:hypothetical protein
VSRRKLAALEARIRKLEGPAKELARNRLSEGLAAYDRLRSELVPVTVYKDGLLRRIEYETRDALEAADHNDLRERLKAPAQFER